MGYINKVKVGNETHLIEPTVYVSATSTAASGSTPQNYSATLTGFEYVTGAQITVRFAETNTADATLQINSAAAKPMYYNGSKLTAGILKALHLYSFVYDTSINSSEGGWRLIGDLDTNLVTGVKGNSETNYRTGNVNITKSNIGLGNVENTKLSTWTGSENITTIGTLSNGTVPWARLSDIPTASTSTAGITKVGASGGAAAYSHTHDTINCPSLTTEANIENGTRSYYGSGSTWTGSITSMQYAGILQICGSYSRGWQIWATRGNNNTESLHWRNPNEDATAWNEERIIIDSGNYKSYAWARPSSITTDQVILSNGTDGSTTLRAILNNTSVGALGWNSGGRTNTNNLRLVDVNTIAYWNGAFSGTTSNLSVLGTVTTGTWNASIIGAAYGGTGQNTLQKSANVLINALDTGSSDLTANDYVITQYVGGGTTTTTYHRRPASKVVNATLVKAALGTVSTTAKKFLKDTGNWTQVDWGDLTNIPSTFTPSSHEHGYIGKDHYIAYPSDGTYEGSGTVTGYIKIKIPETKSATMFSFDVDIYNYVSDTTTRYHIAGYNYDNASWNNCTAYCIAPLSNAKANLSVRFLSNGNDEMYVTIGETNTSWSYPKVVIHDIALGHSNATLAKWKSGWTTTITNTAFDDAQVKRTITNTNIAYTTQINTAAPTASGKIGYFAITPATSGSNTLLAQESLYIYDTIANNAITNTYLCIGKQNSIKGGITLQAGNSYYGDLVTASLTANRTYTLPDATGTIALTSSNITGTAANVTGTVTVAHGGTGVTTADPHKVLIGPSSGTAAAAPTWRVLAAADIPDISGTYLKLTGGTLTGDTYFNSSTGSKKFYITRLGGTAESTGMWQDDSYLHIDVTNDETTANVQFKLSATDTEGSDGSRAQTSYVTFSGADSKSTVTANYFNGLASTATGDADGNAIKTTYAKLASPTFTGTPKSETPTSSSDAKMIATKEYVDGILAANDALVYKGILNKDATETATSLKNIPASGYSAGWTYKVAVAGTYANVSCEVGDMVIAVTNAGTNQSAVDNNHWTVVQANLVGAVVADSGENGYIAKFSGSNTITKGPKIGTSTTKWLNETGAWSTPTAANVGASANDHVHGNITNGGGMTATGVALANGDTLLFVDSSDTNKLIKQTSITFDGSTTTQALSKKGSWESTVNVNIAADDTSSTDNYPIVYATGKVATTTAQNSGLKKTTTKLYFQPSTGTLTATKFSGELSGNAATATTANSSTTATTAYFVGKGRHTAAITVNEFTPSVGTLTILGHVSNTTMTHSNNANAEMIIKAHPTSGSSYYEARLGFSGNGNLYYMPVDQTDWKQIAYKDEVDATLIEIIDLT